MHGIHSLNPHLSAMPTTKRKPATASASKTKKSKTKDAKATVVVASATFFVQVTVNNAAGKSVAIHADARDHARHAGHPTPEDVATWFKAQVGGTSAHAKDLREALKLRRVQVRAAADSERKQLSSSVGSGHDVIAVTADLTCSAAASAGGTKEQQAELLACMQPLSMGTRDGAADAAFEWPEMTSAISRGGPWFPLGRVVGIGGWKTRRVSVTA